ncbi:MAG TPA: hypothetical protein VJP77_09935, partial [Planctomycetota bacterium]|nr:hypothetical protein [Planctomycetota bacterium]
PTDRGYFARGWTGDASLTEDVSAALLAVDRAALVAAPRAARVEAFRAVWRAWEFSTGVGEADWSASSRARGLVDALFESDVDAIRSEAHRFPLGLEGLRDDLLVFASELESGETSVDTLKPRDELETLFTDSFSEVGIPPYEVLVHLLVPADWTELGDLAGAPGADPRRNRWLLAVWTTVLQAAEENEPGVVELARGLYAQSVLERWPIDYGEPEEPEIAAAVLAALAHGDDGLAEEHVGKVCAWVEEALTLSEGKRLFASEDAAVDERTGFIFNTLEVAALVLRDSDGLARMLRTPLALVSGDAFCAWVRAGAPAASRVALHVATIAEEAAGASFGAGLTAPRYGTIQGGQEA